jgi:hypothetical protein
VATEGLFEQTVTSVLPIAIDLMEEKWNAAILSKAWLCLASALFAPSGTAPQARAPMR